MRKPVTSRASSGPVTLPPIRKAAPADWPAMEALLESARLPLDGARDHLASFVIAERGGAIVGCAGVERYGDAALLRSVAVAESERSRGVGAALVERCLADARAKGLSTVLLLTTTAEQFFPRFGFEVVDRAGVPDAVRESAEFRGACPASATVMRLAIGGTTAP
jgi:amino-acid N-acetyltransferase